MAYYYKNQNIDNFLQGTSSGTIYDHYLPNFPGTTSYSDVDANADDPILHPLDFGYTYDTDSKLVSNIRYATYRDFTVTDVLSYLYPPPGTTHISAILIGGGGGGGGSGGGNNPQYGSDTAGAGGGGGASGIQGFVFKYPYSSSLRVYVGDGGDGGSCEYRQDGGPGKNGSPTLLYKYIGSNKYSALVQASGGDGGSGGNNGNANKDGDAPGAGGVLGNNFTSDYIYTPNASCTKNINVAGGAGQTWSNANNKAAGGGGGSLSRLLNNSSNYGNGGNGGEANGKGSGPGANDGVGNKGKQGFCRIYYLIE
jgi:hypothetical protein